MDTRYTVILVPEDQSAVRRYTVIGSNVFNITAVAGAAALANPLLVPGEILERDLWWMIGASLLLTPFVLFCHRISRPAGAAFLVLYGTYGYLALSG